MKLNAVQWLWMSDAALILFSLWRLLGGQGYGSARQCTRRRAVWNGWIAERQLLRGKTVKAAVGRRRAGLESLLSGFQRY